jgi:transposase-like protein
MGTGTSKYTTQDFIDAIPGTGGIVSAIARKVGCDWATANKWVNEYPTVKRVYDAECESMLDLAESVILKNIKDGDTADAKWYLTKRGKRRGYGDAVELLGKDGGDITVNVVDYRRGLDVLAPDEG